MLIYGVFLIATVLTMPVWDGERSEFEDSGKIIVIPVNYQEPLVLSGDSLVVKK